MTDLFVVLGIIKLAMNVTEKRDFDGFITKKNQTLEALKWATIF